MHRVTPTLGAWNVAGSYFEVCNCEAICPCRMVGGAPGGRSSYGDCRFALSWFITEGHAGSVPLNGLGVVMVGWYHDDEPGSPWRVSLYVDERCNEEQADALTAIYLGRAGGTPTRNFTDAIGEVHHVRRARIELSHERRRWAIRAARYVSVRASEPVESEQPVACGIPGLDRPGEEVVADTFDVADDPLDWQFSGRCGFATSFDYRSD
jgi:hypothetical protein